MRQVEMGDAGEERPDHALGQVSRQVGKVPGLHQRGGVQGDHFLQPTRARLGSIRHNFWFPRERFKRVPGGESAAAAVRRRETASS